MHDVIRDMATWITHDRGETKNKLLVIEDEEEMSVEISKWEGVEKVSLWGSSIANINPTLPTCIQLKTLFVRETQVSLVPSGFFKSACLKVLDLSDNENIKSFPKEICDLISLRYLNLSCTSISELPKEIEKLTQLRWLLLDSMELDIPISRGAITSLRLSVFSMWGMILQKEEEVIEELGDMQRLTDLSITVQKYSSALKIFQSFQKCIRRVRIENCEDLSHLLKGSGNFSHLEELHLVNCPMLVKMENTQCNRSCFPSLVQVWINDCGFLELSWLVQAPKLQILRVLSCHSMQKIIGDGFAREELAASRLFSHLEYLCIWDLPNLRSICDHTLFFPQGMEFYIDWCPGLGKLPLDSNSARGSFSIYGDKYWWAKFEWDPAARVTLGIDYQSPIEEMTFGEAQGKMKDGNFRNGKIRFLPSRAE